MGDTKIKIGQSDKFSKPIPLPPKDEKPFTYEIPSNSSSKQDKFYFIIFSKIEEINNIKCTKIFIRSPLLIENSLPTKISVAIDINENKNKKICRKKKKRCKQRNI